MRITNNFTILLGLSIALFYSANGLTNETNTAGSTDDSDQKPQKFYDIELIVFKNKSVPKGSELNLPTPSPSYSDLTIDLSNPDSIEKRTELGFSSLQQEELRLLDTVQKIVKSSRYELLIHTGWRQPGLDKTESIPVWIKGGQVYGDSYSSIDQDESTLEQQVETVLNEQSLLADSTGVADVTQTNETDETSQADKVIENAPKGLYEFEGQVKITLSRYLHTHANLVLRKPANTQNFIEDRGQQSEQESTVFTGGQRLSNYALNEQRRMRSTKLHYLDHPQFGMLVLITPYDAPPEEEELVQENEVETTMPGNSPIAIESQQ